MELKLSDIRSVEDYKGWRTVERYAFNPRDYPDDQSEQQRRLDFFLESIVPSKFEWWELVVNQFSTFYPIP